MRDEDDIRMRSGTLELIDEGAEDIDTTLVDFCDIFTFPRRVVEGRPGRINGGDMGF
jgi:hypothetical protein